MARFPMKITGGATAVAIVLGSSSGNASASVRGSGALQAPASINPLVVLSALGSQASRDALRSAATSTSRLGREAASPQSVASGTNGCGLRIVDQPIRPVVRETDLIYSSASVAGAPVPGVSVGKPRFSFLPLLATLCNLALLLSHENDFEPM